MDVETTDHPFSITFATLELSVVRDGFGGDSLSMWRRPDDFCCNYFCFGRAFCNASRFRGRATLKVERPGVIMSATTRSAIIFATARSAIIFATTRSATYLIGSSFL